MDPYERRSRVGRAPALEIDMVFDIILENLDIGAIVYFEAHNKNGWEYLEDYGIWISLFVNTLNKCAHGSAFYLNLEMFLI